MAIAPQITPYPHPTRKCGIFLSGITHVESLGTQRNDTWHIGYLCFDYGSRGHQLQIKYSVRMFMT